MKEYWYTLPLNSEPWAVGPLSIGRRNGKIFPMIGPNSQLQAFQEAVRELLVDAVKLSDGEYQLTFYIWRRIEEYQGVKKKVVKNVVDATNLQKGLEDALQGVLFDNDRDVRDIRTIIVEQSLTTEPRICIRAALFPGFEFDDLPDFVWEDIDAARDAPSPQSKLWGDGGNIF